MRLLVSILVTITLPVFAQEQNETSLEALVDELQKVSAEGFGYSSSFSGTAFLPRKDTALWQTGILGAKPPQESKALRGLVAAGAKAIPVLTKHLDDKRPTQIKPVSGMMWMTWNDEYDFNRRIRKQSPKGVNRDDFLEERPRRPDSHQICVGDLCFAALGQIVNRSFDAARYQPTGGLVVSSPANSERLLKVVKEDYSTMTRDQHRDSLIRDFKEPDAGFRRDGAVVRLAFYYPEVLDDLVIRQLTVPTYDVFVAETFVRKVLYPIKSAGKRREKLQAHVLEHGEAARDGILLQLFEDLDTQIADEEGRHVPPLKFKYDARNVLDVLFNYSPPFTPSAKPFVTSWSAQERVNFIESLGNAASEQIKQEVRHIFRGIKDDDALALACMIVLQDCGYNAELTAYCKRRETSSKHYGESLRSMRQELEKEPDRPKAP